MSLPVYTSLAVANEHGRWAAWQIGRRYSVDRRRVHMWAKRRANTGFPEAIAYYQMGSRLIPLYRHSEVQRWLIAWERKHPVAVPATT